MKLQVFWSATQNKAATPFDKFALKLKVYRSEQGCNNQDAPGGNDDCPRAASTASSASSVTIEPPLDARALAGAGAMMLPREWLLRKFRSSFISTSTDPVVINK